MDKLKELVSKYIDVKAIETGEENGKWYTVIRIDVEKDMVEKVKKEMNIN